MLNKKPSRPSLALFVALALGSSAFLAPSSPVTAADVTIDNGHAPSGNAPDPNTGTGSFGSAAGVINDPANSDDVSGNTMTLDDYDYSSKNIFGGFTRGTGRAIGNTIHIRNGGDAASAYGGFTWGGGNAEDNKVYLHLGNTVRHLVGGFIGHANGNAVNNRVEITDGGTKHIYGGWLNNPGATGKADQNHIVINHGTIAGSVYGGAIWGTASTGSVTGNTVTIAGGTVQAGTGANHNHVYGGYTQGNGNVSGNKVTITGGDIGDNVYGGFAQGNGDVTGNKVYLTGTRVGGSVYGGYGADRTKDNEVYLNGGVDITGTLYGGNSTRESTGNKLFVEGKDNKAQKVDGFQQMTFKTDGVAAGQTMLKVTGTAKTKVDWEKLEATGTATGITLLQNDRNIILSNYTYSNQVKSKLSADGKSEYDIEIVAVAGNARKITYNRYRFEGNRTLSRSTNRLGVMMTWGGLSLVGNTTTKNIVTLDHSVAGVHQYIYGGWSRRLNVNSGGDGDSTANELTIAETAVLAGSNVYIYGGYAEVGKAEGNTVTIKRNVNGLIQGGHSGGSSAVKNIVHIGNVTITGEVVGGSSFDTANENEVHLTGTTVTGDVSGGAIGMDGEGTTAKDNKVYLNGGVTIQGGLYGGDSEDISTGNQLFVKGKDNKAGLVKQFQKMEFDTTGVNQDDTMLTATNGTATNDINWDTLDVTGSVANGKITLLKNTAGIHLTGRAAGQRRSTLNKDGKSEQHIDVVNGDPSNPDRVTEIIAEGYQFKDKTTLSSITESGVTSTWGGRSKMGNTTTGNNVTVEADTHTNAYGGWTTGEGTTATEKGSSTSNTITINGTADVTGTVYGGYTDVADGKALKNTVTIEKDLTSSIVAGHSTNGEASDNIVSLTDHTLTGDIIGGRGTVTNNNIIHLKNAAVTGTVTGGTAADGTGNTLKVCYGTKSSEIGDFQGIRNLHFDLEKAPSDGTAHTLLNLKNVSGGSKSLADTTIELYRSGDAKKLEKGDSFTLMDNQTAGGGFTIDETTKVKGMNGISYNYEFEIAPDKDNVQKLKATVTKVGMTEATKSPVETRAGLASFVNQGADTLVESGISAAEMAVSADAGAAGGKSGAASKSNDAKKNVQRKTAAANNAAYQLWAGAGANNMRVESGSYVDSKGWSLGVGWAREDVAKDGAKRLFSPFVEYGRGTYDSYLDDGAHGSGKISYLGIGVLGKRTQKNGLWLEGSVRGGRATSDYSANIGGTSTSYDGSNTYYGIHLGVGKTVEMKNDATIDTYARYFWSHQNGMTAHLSSGDTYDFADVDSHRLRLGLRYNQKNKAAGEFYTGLAWEYEFAGAAKATIGGDAAPSPSLKGSSYMLELGYRFQPQNSRISYDLHLNGWQGKRKGISGGVSVNWAF